MPELRNLRTGAVIAARVRVAGTPGARALGFLSRDAVDPHEGIVFENCAEMDTYGMRVPLDILFLDRNGRVLAAHRGVVPNRPSLHCVRASWTVQLGTGLERDLQHGDQLKLV